MYFLHVGIRIHNMKLIISIGLLFKQLRTTRIYSALVVLLHYCNIYVYFNN